MTRTTRDHLERLGLLCASCGKCCQEPIVPLTDADVRRLARHTGREASEFVRMYGPGEVDFDRDELGVVELATGERFMGLRKRGGRCIFLDGRNRCTVYPARPLTCRTFPYDLDLDDEGGVEAVRMMRCVPCLFRRRDAVHLPDLPRASRREDREDAAYERKVERWNREGRKALKADYLRWLGY